MRRARARWIYQRTEQRTLTRGQVVTTGHAVPGGSPGWDPDGALNPLRTLRLVSCSPATGALELLSAVRTGIDRLRRDLRAAAGLTWGGRRAPEEALREIVGLALEVDDGTAADAARQIRAWVAQARVTLGYDAPIVQLRDVVCGICGGDLRVRADASSAVWCAGHPAAWSYGPNPPGGDWGPVMDPAEPGCGERYERGRWLELLESTVIGKSDVGDEATA